MVQDHGKDKKRGDQDGLDQPDQAGTFPVEGKAFFEIFPGVHIPVHQTPGAVMHGGSRSANSNNRDAADKPGDIEQRQPAQRCGTAHKAAVIVEYFHNKGPSL